MRKMPNFREHAQKFAESSFFFEFARGDVSSTLPNCALFASRSPGALASQLFVASDLSSNTDLRIAALSRSV